VGLKNSRQECVIKNGQTLFLEMSQEENSPGLELRFSSDPTPLWVKILVLDRSSLLLEAGILMRPEGTDAVVEEKAQFVLKDVASAIMSHQKETKRGEHPYYKLLKQAKVWGTDALLQNYGGEEYHSVQDKYKIEFTNGTSSYVEFVGNGDYLTWDGEKWKQVPLKEAFSDQPIACVKASPAKGLEIEAWDETGFYPGQLKLDFLRSNKVNFRPENLPSSIRIRSSSQVTCLFGKRRVILKKGDWLLKTPNGWRKLKKEEEIEDCIHHRIRGELFVFDGIEKEKDALLLKGHLFDEMRTVMQPVAIPVAGEKKEKKKERKSLFLKKTAAQPSKGPHIV
jgi:hypothetical protein